MVMGRKKKKKSMHKITLKDLINLMAIKTVRSSSGKHQASTPLIGAQNKITYQSPCQGQGNFAEESTAVKKTNPSPVGPEVLAVVTFSAPRENTQCEKATLKWEINDIFIAKLEAH